jgi:hypothetical protein
METVACDLLLCSEHAAYVRICSPARDFLQHLCACHWKRLRNQDPDLAACYEPISPARRRRSPRPIVLLTKSNIIPSVWNPSGYYGVNPVSIPPNMCISHPSSERSLAFSAKHRKRSLRDDSLAVTVLGSQAASAASAITYGNPYREYLPFVARYPVPPLHPHL